MSGKKEGAPETESEGRGAAAGGCVLVARWRAIRRAHLVALVRAGATFENGVLAERAEADAA